MIDVDQAHVVTSSAPWALTQRCGHADIMQHSKGNKTNKKPTKPAGTQGGNNFGKAARVKGKHLLKSIKFLNDEGDKGDDVDEDENEDEHQDHEDIYDKIIWVWGSHAEKAAHFRARTRTKSRKI